MNIIRKLLGCAFALLLLQVSTGVQARTSLESIEAQIQDLANQVDALVASAGDYHKVILVGDMPEGSRALTSSPGTSYTVSAGQRFHVGQIDCNTQQSYTGAIVSQSMILYISGRFFSSELGRTVPQTLVLTPSGADILTFREINNYRLQLDTFFDPGSIIEMRLTRNDDTGQITGYTCVLSGFLEDL